MNTLDLSNIFSVAGYVAGVAGALFYARSKVPGQTIANYEKLTVAQEKRIKALEDQSKIDHQNHLDSIRAIADLQGQIKVYKEMPLQEMATAMQKISDTNQLILTALNQPVPEEKPEVVTTVSTTTTKKKQLRGK